MENKPKKHIFIKIIIVLAVFAGILYYAYSFPRTMELLDEAVSKIIKTAGIETETEIFSKFSAFSKETVEKAIYWVEVIEENIKGNLPKGKKVFTSLITCAAKFPAEEEKVTSTFGKRINPISGTDEIHNGIDISAAMGSAVFSAWPGKVIETGFDEIYGNYILIEHSEGFLTKYCHLSKIGAAVGDFIKAGEKIGEAGSTGWSTGSHLHFEVYVGGKNIDPGECFEA